MAHSPHGSVSGEASTRVARVASERAGLAQRWPVCRSREGRGSLQGVLTRIEQPLTAIPAVVACYLVSGSDDFFVEAVVPDLAGYEQLLIGQILAIPSIVEARSTFAIRTVLSRGPLPLGHWK